MMNKTLGSYKIDKKKIGQKHSILIKKNFFSWKNAMDISKKFGYEYIVIKNFVGGRATKNYVDKDWVKWRRCRICKAYKKLEWNYLAGWKNKDVTKIYYKSECNYCNNLLKNNERKIIENIYGKEKIKNKQKEKWGRHGWKYNIRRKILRIIWILDSKNKLIDNAYKNAKQEFKNKQLLKKVTYVKNNN